MNAIQLETKQFIVDNFLFGGTDDGLTPDASLLKRGIIDSTGVMELVLFIENSYGIEVEDEEIVPENLDSLSRIAKYVESKQND
jgi:acyl carrier protein